jgi:hypothetical protein
MNENIQVIRELIEDINSASQGMTTEFSQRDMEAKLREQFTALFGTANPSYQDLKRRPVEAAEFFALMEEFIATDASLKIQKELPWVDYRNTAWGDEAIFEIENGDLFDVAVIAKGNGNLRRQRLENGELRIPTEAVGVKIFENFKRFLSGRVNWAAMITKVSNSYVKYIRDRVYTAFYAVAPVNGSTVFNVNDAGGFNIESVYTLVDHVQAENQGADIVIIGTRQALRKMAPIVSTDEANRDLYEKGYYTSAEGYKLVPVDQAHVAGTFNFLLSNKQLMVAPMTTEGMVKVVEEGTPIIEDMPLNAKGDMSKEFLYYREVGVAVVTGTKFGKYTFA